MARYREWIMLKTVTIVFSLATTIALAGCGTPRGNAMATDGAVGAGGGALLGAVAGFNPLVGAAVGGAGGAAVGAATH
jgi:osmotically inducible lipoprotein OsmB